jgi:uncharacterized protein (TIGR01777 family)
MRIVIAGGAGFLGRALTDRLRSRGDTVRVLSRRPAAREQVQWDPSDSSGAWTEEIAVADAVINLAGEPVDRGRWTPTRKAALVNSRIQATRAIAAALRARQSQATLLNASAVGFYGSRGSETLTEDSPPGDDFLARLCVAWETEAVTASPRSRVVLLRTGLVLAADGGALARLLAPFRVGVGGPFGEGHQYWPWIHRDDWISLVLFAIDQSVVSGPLNLTAPQPVTNREFARVLGQVLHRPAVLPAPAFALRLALGEMADAMLLGGQRAVPARAQAAGFVFAYTDLAQALEQLTN